MSNVVSLFAARDKKETNTEEPKKAEVSQEELEAIAKKNKTNEERLKKERANANKSVLRSYRIKN